jgi:uncharacterized cupredoxin-like copper-binding protein
MQRIILVALIFIFLLSGCAAAPRKGVTAIGMTISDGRFSPAQWRITGGAQITLTLSNETQVEHEWVLLKDPPKDAYSPADDANALFRLTIAPAETRTVQFKSPAAPGEYSAVCAKPGHLEEGESARLLVVQPGY